jgi:hemerythrin-like domain-containing protein
MTPHRVPLDRPAFKLVRCLVESMTRPPGGVMTSESIRDKVLEEHDRIRDMLAAMDAERKLFEAEASNGPGELVELAGALFEVFAAHIQLEDATLVPALRALGGHRAIAADRLEREHIEQRELLRFLMQRLEAANRPTSLLVCEIHQFGEYLRTDMAHEEAAILREDLLGGPTD